MKKSDLIAKVAAVIERRGGVLSFIGKINNPALHKIITGSSKGAFKSPDLDEVRSEVEAVEKKYLKAGDPELHVRVGGTNTLDDLRRIRARKDISGPERVGYSIGTVVINPLANLLGMDMYNTGSQTANIYHNIKGVAAHEAGHHAYKLEGAHRFSHLSNHLTRKEEMEASRRAINALPADQRDKVLNNLLNAYSTYEGDRNVLEDPKLFGLITIKKDKPLKEVENILRAELKKELLKKPTPPPKAK